MDRQGRRRRPTATRSRDSTTTGKQFSRAAGEAMKSESPGAKPGAITRTHDSSGQPAGSPETLAEWALKYAATGLEVFPRRPRHKSANRGDRRPQRRNNMDGNQRPPFRHQRPRNHHRLVDVATGCPNRRPNTQRRGGARYRPPPRRPRHMGHHRRRSRSTGHTPCTLPAATTAVFTFGFGTPTVDRTQGP